jgi:hypothetical protein
MERLSLSLPSCVAERIRDAARDEGATLSAWLLRAVEDRLLLRNAAAPIAAWEQEHGALSAEERAAVEGAWLG